MNSVAHHSVKWGSFLGELCALLMLYSAVLLMPGSFNWVAITMIGFIASVSCAFAYFSSSRFKDPANIKRLRLRQVICKPPFVVWFTVVGVILLQLGDGLYMLYLVNKK